MAHSMAVEVGAHMHLVLPGHSLYDLSDLIELHSWLADGDGLVQGFLGYFYDSSFVLMVGLPIEYGEIVVSVVAFHKDGNIDVDLIT